MAGSSRPPPKKEKKFLPYLHIKFEFYFSNYLKLWRNRRRSKRRRRQIEIALMRGVRAMEEGGGSGVINLNRPCVNISSKIATFYSAVT